MKNKTTVSFFLLALIFGMAATLCSAEMTAMPQASSGEINKNNLEGWIISVDYRQSQFRLLDPRGFQSYVHTKPGTIGDYRIGDKVRVAIDPDRKIASQIQKLY